MNRLSNWFVEKKKLRQENHSGEAGKTARNLKIEKSKREIKKNKMKNFMTLFGLLLIGTLTLESCGQNNSSNNDNPAPINSEENSSETTNKVDPNSSLLG